MHGKLLSLKTSSLSPVPTLAKQKAEVLSRTIQRAADLMHNGCSHKGSGNRFSFHPMHNFQHFTDEATDILAATLMVLS